MAKQVALAVSPREVSGKGTKRLRAAGIIPANIFGHGEEPQAVQVMNIDFEELRRGHHTTGVISLQVAGTQKTQTALVRHVQRHPLSGKILHIDFQRVSLRDRITSRVSLRLIGTAPGVKTENGVLLHLTDTLEVECMASDIVEAIEVDISRLEHVDDILHAKDIPLPPNYTLMTDPEEAVVKISASRMEKAEGAEEASAEAPATSESAKE